MTLMLTLKGGLDAFDIEPVIQGIGLYRIVRSNCKN